MTALPIPLSPTAQATMMLQQQASNMQMQSSGIFIPPQMMNVSDPTQFIKHEPISHEMPPRSNASPIISPHLSQQMMDQVKTEEEKPAVTTTTTPTEHNAMEST